MLFSINVDTVFDMKGSGGVKARGTSHKKNNVSLGSPISYRCTDVNILCKC